MFQLESQGFSFTILQWNCLADSLCTQDSFPMVDTELLQWNRRQELYQSVFPNITADIICLEEVDHPDFFKSLLPEYYECHFYKKKDGLDGTFVAFNSQKFTKLNIQQNIYKVDNQETNQFNVALDLEHIQSKKHLLVIGTHLKAKKQNDPIRVHQIQQIIELLNERNDSHPIIVLGDFNTEPESESMQSFLKAKSDKYASVNHKNHITTYKQRKTEECRTIDYIHYSSDHLLLVGHNRLLEKQQIGPKGLPTNNFPSDHLFLFGVFKFL